MRNLPIPRSIILFAIAIVAALVAAGCIQPATDGELTPSSTANVPAGKVADVAGTVAHTVTGDVVELPPHARDLTVRIADTGLSGAEPTLGVTSDGTIWTNPYEVRGLVKSTDHGRTWEEVGSTVHDPKVNFDPWMWVDPTTDRVFNAPLYVACTHMAWTDDGGESWESNPVGGCGLPAHDHQKLTSGPPAPGVDTVGYPNVLYYAYNGAFRGFVGPETLDGTWVTTSLDGGHTWTPGEKVFEPSECKSGINGPVAVGPDGTAYVAHGTCQGTKVAVSLDSGQSWEVVHHFTDIGMYRGLAINPDIAVDSEGNAYLLTPGGDGQLYLTVGRNKGQVWSDPVRVTPPHVNFTVFSVVTAGEPGRVSIGYLGTSADASTWERPEPSYASDDTVWHTYLATTTNALDPEPTFVSTQVTPDDDPTQRGCVWLWGGGNDCRNLLDFIDMVEHDGRPYLVYADGCDACTSADESRESITKVAILERGPSLLDGTLQPLVDLAGEATGGAGTR